MRRMARPEPPLRTRPLVPKPVWEQHWRGDVGVPVPYSPSGQYMSCPLWLLLRGEAHYSKNGRREAQKGSYTEWAAAG